MRYVCSICGYVYDEAQNLSWNTLPDDWKCPLCGAAKADFRPEGDLRQGGGFRPEGAQPSTPVAPTPVPPPDLPPCPRWS